MGKKKGKHLKLCSIAAPVLVRGFSPQIENKPLQGEQSVIVDTLLLRCVWGNSLEGLNEGRAEYDGVGKTKPQKMDAELHEQILAAESPGARVCKCGSHFENKN